MARMVEQDARKGNRRHFCQWHVHDCGEPRVHGDYGKRGTQKMQAVDTGLEHRAQISKDHRRNNYQHEYLTNEQNFDHRNGLTYMLDQGRHDHRGQ